MVALSITLMELKIKILSSGGEPRFHWIMSTLLESMPTIRVQSLIMMFVQFPMGIRQIVVFRMEQMAILIYAMLKYNDSRTISK